MSLKCLLVYNILATFTESPFHKNSYFSNTECKLLKKFGPVLSILVLKAKADVIVCGKATALEGLHAKIMDSSIAVET